MIGIFMLFGLSQYLHFGVFSLFFFFFGFFSLCGYFSEYAGNLGEGEDSEWREQEQQHIIQLIDRF